MSSKVLKHGAVDVFVAMIDLKVHTTLSNIIILYDSLVRVITCSTEFSRAQFLSLAKLKVIIIVNIF